MNPLYVGLILAALITPVLVSKKINNWIERHPVAGYSALTALVFGLSGLATVVIA